MFKKLYRVLILSSFAFQAMGTIDTGKVIEIYTHPDGQMALKLDNGLPNSNSENNCGSANNEWAGVASTVDSSIKSAILTAKATQSEVVLVTLGNCEGGWIRIEAMHVK